MAGEVQFFDGADASGKGPGSTTPEQPKSGSGPVDFFNGAESVGAFGVPTNPTENTADVSVGKGNTIDSPISD